VPFAVLYFDLEERAPSFLICFRQLNAGMAFTPPPACVADEAW
jgi:hypothetical protein